ncbi:unnamed protein product [Anisakis simplex]|uniref:Mediator of RNA polymerase II transcription subunit 6 n=1 Tax=Anisakis simplex TaxID=6269 RepID=A0A0M3K7J8_ANISI|nr:unnamed protein product [Anisakis simplex]
MIPSAGVGGARGVVGMMGQPQGTNPSHVDFLGASVVVLKSISGASYMGGGPNVGSGGVGAASHQPVIPESLLHQSFKNPNWPPNFITAENVLDYFCDPSNVFYDVSSCNQHLKMQNLNRPLHECLQSMQGIQFAVVGANHPLYVIVKQRRNSPTNVTPLCYYYIVNGTVYQCPDLYTFVQSRLIGVVDPLRRALENARQFCRYDVAKGYYWEFKDSSGGGDDENDKKDDSEEEKPLTARSTFFQRTRTEQLLRDLFERFPPPDDVKFEFDGADMASGAGAETSSTADGSSAQRGQGGAAGSGQGNVPVSEGQHHQAMSHQQVAEMSSRGRQGMNTANPASVPTPESSHQRHALGHEASGGPMSFPGQSGSGSSSTVINGSDVKRFKME